MRKRYLKGLVDTKLSIRDISKETGKGYSTIRYWLNKYSLKTYYNSRPEYHCRECGEEDKNNFYTKKTICRDCWNKYCCNYNVKKKEKAIEYLGGCCQKCKYNEYYGALEFHHINPDEKEFTWKTLRHRSWKVICEELDKCMLLCANCHREEHQK